MKFERKPLHDRELTFWKAMITKYLLPLDEDSKEKKRISDDLIELRNKMVFAFAFMNIIFILFVFMLQLHKDVFGLDIPVGIAGQNRTYNEEEGTWTVETLYNYTRMDPITLFLVVFFGAILIIQLIGKLGKGEGFFGLRGSTKTCFGTFYRNVHSSFWNACSSNCLH